MNIFNSYKRNRFFLWVNITGLAIGLAASILLILFVVNEWSYDRHFANYKRIVRLLTVSDENNNLTFYPIDLRTAYTELPQNVPGVEAAVQLYPLQETELISGHQRFQKVNVQLADSDFFKVFQMKFVEGNAETSFTAPNAAILTRRYANIMFGSPEAAMNQPVSVNGMDFVISGVVEELPENTHFNFDILGTTEAVTWIKDNRGGLQWFTYYLIKKEASVQTVRNDIENAYRIMVKPWGERSGNRKAYGLTEMLSDIHLKSKALGAAGNMHFIYLLTALAFFVLILAVTNFINLFMAQGEMRMQEIGIRKSNGAQITDIVRQFFTEVALVVGIAFAIGLLLAAICVPYFGSLINKNIDMIQLLNPMFILAALLLFMITVVLSAFYPAIYLSRFSPLEILDKRVRFSKRRLTGITVIFQSIISIVLLSVILVLYNQTTYLQQLPLGYNPENVLSVIGNQKINKNYRSIKQELLQFPEVKAVSAADHIFGGGYSGEIIAPWEDKEQENVINEYRVLTGMPELMELKLVEGRFWQESDPDSIPLLILNEAAVRMLGGESPLEKNYAFNGELARVIGVVKDFYYDNPALNIDPIVLVNRINSGNIMYIRYNENVNSMRAQQIVLNVLHRFDPDFVLNPVWSADIYKAKFKEIKTLTLIILVSSAISIFVAMLGLLAIHLFSAIRRTKEIGIRRVFGAEKVSVFLLLSLDVVKWIGIAALFAIPIAVYILSEILNNYANRVHPDWTIFLFPVLIQCVIAILTTSGVSLSILSQNPAKSLKAE